MTIPDNIDRDDIIEAIESGLVNVRGEEENPRKKSTDYALKYDGEYYSPKYLISKANIVANGEELDTDDFRGGEGYANDFLEDRYFEIVSVDDENEMDEDLESEGEDMMVDQEDERSSEWVNEKYKELSEKEGRVEFITFHPSYSYEEFIEGITVNSESEGESDLDYMVKDGIFKRFCARALACAMNKNDWQKYGNPSKVEEKNKEETLKASGDKSWNSIYEQYNGNVDWDEICEDPSKRFLLIIDEINRGDISKIFGELITLIEDDKRLGGDEQKIARLPYSSHEFAVPPNVYLLGTMNTADRSIAMLDIALRRRFSFNDMYPCKEAYEKLRKEKGIHDSEEDNALAKSIETLKDINKEIIDKSKLGRDKMIGSSYFYQVEKKDDFEAVKRVWHHEIFPLLEEYCWDDRRLLKDVTDVSDFDIYDSTKRKLYRNEESLKSWLNIEDQSPADSESEE